METKECPYGDAILHYANERGLENAKIVYLPMFGWELRGDGRCDSGWPLVWSVATELGIATGGGGTDYKQIKPEQF